MREASSAPDRLAWNNRFLLLIAGLGGLLYGIDVGIIAGALPYLEATSGLSGNQLSVVVAAVLLGSVLSTIFAGALADLMGRKKLMALSGVLFVASIPMIALAHGYGPLVLGRLLQGTSAGLVGVVVPLYLAECLGAESRGRGTAMFQWLLTAGISAAAIIAWIFSLRVEAIEHTGNAQALFAFKDLAWRSIFWVSVLPGIFFTIGSFFVAESPRWLYRKGLKTEAREALLRTRTSLEADGEMQEMEISAKAEAGSGTEKGGHQIKESLLRRKYVIPFVLACIILACNQLTGINSIIGYNATILIQAGLSDANAHLGYIILTLVNFGMTAVGMILVDRKGRKFLLSLGSAGIIVSLVFTGFIFHRTEAKRVECASTMQTLVSADQQIDITLSPEVLQKLIPASSKALLEKPSTMVVTYAYGDFRTASAVIRAGSSLKINRESLPSSKVAAFFANPFASLAEAKQAPLHIENAILTPVPSSTNGWLAAIGTFIFMAFFAVGPGICVWLALSELMPTRIRSNGMSVALLINQAVSTTIAAVFLPTVGKHGYGTMFFGFAAFTLIYFITAAFFLPETKGKTLEEIEAHFEGNEA